MIEFVRQILKKELTENQLKLVEKDEQSGMEISISGMPDERLFVTLPSKGQHLDCLVESKIRDKNGYKYLRRACDFIVMAEQNEEIDVYLVEAKETIPNIKTNNFRVEGACEQIICTLPILEYLLTMVKVHHHQPRKINRYFVVIGQKISDRLDKQDVKYKPPHFLYPFKNKKFKVLYGETIKFKHLK